MIGTKIIDLVLLLVLLWLLQVVSITRDDQELIVINPQWLCTDMIGKLLSHDCFSNRPVDGRFLLQDLQSVFPKSDAQDIVFMLDALELCYASHQRGEPELTIGCFNHAQSPPADAQPTDQVGSDSLSTSSLLSHRHILDFYPTSPFV